MASEQHGAEGTQEGQQQQEALQGQKEVTSAGNKAASTGYKKAIVERDERIVEVPQSRFYKTVALNSGDGFFNCSGATPLNFMVVDKGAAVKFDEHTASRVFQPDELESLDSYMTQCRKYGLVDVFENKVAGVYVSAAAGTEG